jgi:phosphatidylserine/phosphatidylglycerophosphate/cardiolipin synthase-like enzyme
LYVHAKVGIVDDRWLTVGSANLNAHSLLNDTEMNVCSDHPELARHTRRLLGPLQGLLDDG